jgi:amino acid adenylation domain-containing protein
MADAAMRCGDDELRMAQWNATEVPYPLHIPVHELFRAQSHRTPERMAVAYGSASLTYRELNAKSNQLARYLERNGIQAGQPVGIYADRSLELVIALLGVLKAGGVYVPIDPSYPADRRAYVIEDSGAATIITQDHLLAELHDLKDPMAVCLDRDWERIGDEADVDPPATDHPGELASILYTSGSTGRPKGVLNTHQGLTNRLLWMQDAYALRADDRVLQKTPIGFDVSGWEFFWPLTVGAGLVIARPGGHRDTQYLIDAIQQQSITTLHFVPPMLQAFLATDGVEACTCLRRVICSGDILRRETQQEFFAKLPEVELYNLYGPTEASIDVTAWRCARDDTNVAISIGRPIANTQIHILDDALLRVPVGTAGEIYIGGVQVARGYHNRPDLTKERFVPDPFSADPNARLYRTGDLGVYRRDGAIDFLGRLDNQVKIRGVRIELGEIEAVLATSPDIKDAVVVAYDRSPTERQLAAYVVPAADTDFDARAMREFLRHKLPEAMIPAYFIPLERIPLTPNGKIDRVNLPNPRERRRTKS